jgi:hypothetical protein
LILKLQGDGDYEGVKQFMAKRGVLSSTVTGDLARLGGKRIPVDVVFDQGPAVLGLRP